MADFGLNNFAKLILGMKVFEKMANDSSKSFNTIRKEFNKTFNVERMMAPKPGGDLTGYFKKKGESVWRRRSDEKEVSPTRNVELNKEKTQQEAQAAMQAQSPLGKITGGLKKLMGIPFKPFTKTIGAVGSGFKSLWSGFGSVGPQQGRLAKMGQSIGNVAQRITKIPAASLKSMAGAFGSMAMAGMASGGLMILVQVLMELLSAFNPFKDLMSALTDIFGVYGDILSQAMIPLITKLFDVMLSPQVLEMFQMMADAFMQIVVALLPMIDLFLPLGTLLMMGLLIPLQLLAPIISLLAIPLNLLAPLFAGLNAVLQGLTVGIGTSLNKLGDMVMGWVKGIYNGVAGVINWAINATNKAIIIDAWKIPNIPYMNTGGIVRSPTVAMIGERRDEAIIPLEELPKLMGQMNNGNSGGGSIVVNIQGDLTEERLLVLQRELWLRNMR